MTGLLIIAAYAATVPCLAEGATVTLSGKLEAHHASRPQDAAPVLRIDHPPCFKSDFGTQGLGLSMVAVVPETPTDARLIDQRVGRRVTLRGKLSEGLYAEHPPETPVFLVSASLLK